MSLSRDADDKVLAAADSLRRRHDGGFTMAQLARTAGMSRATLYRRFGGRDRLVAALADQGAAPRSLRDRLLAATCELLGERGPLGFSLEEVAARADASVTSIYREFGERDELVRGAIATLGSTAPLRALLADEAAPLRPTLEAFVAAGLARFESQPLLVRIVLTPDPAAWRYLQQVRARENKVSRAVTQYFAAQLLRRRVRGESPERLATSLVGLLLGDVMRHRLLDDRPPYQARARAVVDMFLHGAAARPARRRP